MVIPWSYNLYWGIQPIVLPVVTRFIIKLGRVHPIYQLGYGQKTAWKNKTSIACGALDIKIHESLKEKEVNFMLSASIWAIKIKNPSTFNPPVTRITFDLSTRVYPPVVIQYHILHWSYSHV